MPIIVNLDVMMAKRKKISLNELSERVGLTLSNLSILKPVEEARKQFVLAPWTQFVKHWTANGRHFWNM